MRNYVNLVASKESSIVDLISSLEPYSVFIFGSVLTEDFNSSSDIDIGFLSNLKSSINAQEEVRENLEKLIGRDVDLVNLNDVSMLFKCEVLSNCKFIVYDDNLVPEYLERLMYINRRDYNLNYKYQRERESGVSWL